ncbi:MAG: hypothetical protein ABSC23_14585 [Bryobacteraceae bacterium]
MGLLLQINNEGAATHDGWIDGSRSQVTEAAFEAGRTLGNRLRWVSASGTIPHIGWISRAPREVTEQAYARAQQNTGAAAAVLLKLTADPATPASGRIRAALGIFGLAREALDLDMETRVSALACAAELAESSRR